MAAIRASEPSRPVRVAAGNAPTRFVRTKMDWVATESRTIELPYARGR